MRAGSAHTPVLPAGRGARASLVGGTPVESERMSLAFPRHKIWPGPHWSDGVRGVIQVPLPNQMAAVAATWGSSAKSSGAFSCLGPPPPFGYLPLTPLVPLSSIAQPVVKCWRKKQDKKRENVGPAMAHQTQLSTAAIEQKYTSPDRRPRGRPRKRRMLGAGGFADNIPGNNDGGGEVSLAASAIECWPSRILLFSC